MSGGEANILGVLGGMGPLASAEFVKTIYEHSGGRCQREQECPTVIVYSDPTFPDRTAAFLRGDDALLLERLTAALERLREMGATRSVICCMTIHHLLPRLPPALRAHVLSVVEVILAHVARRRGRHLLVCSSGTRKLEIFQRHELWPAAREHIVWPTEAEQQRIHELIYEVKKNRGIPRTVAYLESLLAAHGVDSFVAGCSEVHLLAKHFLAAPRSQAYDCLDPFDIIARQVTEHNLHEI